MSIETYNLSAFGDNIVSHASIRAEIIAAGLPNLESIEERAGDVVAFSFTDDLTAPQITTLDGVVSAHAPALQDAKDAKNRAIDIRTRELIAEGFVFSSKTFSLSLEGQARLAGINQVRTDGSISYPIRWNTLDDSDALDLADAATFLSFYLTAVGAYRGHIDSGTALKDDVRAAVSVAAVNAITDTR